MSTDKLYFGGGAFGFSYYIGVLRALYENNHRASTVYGNSAGALMAMLYLLRMPTEDIDNLFQDVIRNTVAAIQSRPLDISSYQLTEPNLRLFEVIRAKYPNAYKICNRRLHIGITKVTSGFQWKSRFSSNLELFNTLLCSYNIPFVCNYLAEIDGEKCIDGCLGFNMSRHLPRDVFTIGANDTNCVLNGQIPTVHCLLPPPMESYHGYVERGYNDMRGCDTATRPMITDESSGLVWLAVFACRLQPLCNKMYSRGNLR